MQLYEKYKYNHKRINLLLLKLKEKKINEMYYMIQYYLNNEYDIV